MADDWSSLGGTVVSGPPAASPSQGGSAPASAPTPDDWGSLGGKVTAAPPAPQTAGDDRTAPLREYMHAMNDPAAAARYWKQEWDQGTGAAIGKLAKDVGADFDADKQRLAQQRGAGFWDRTQQGLDSDQRFLGIIGDVGNLFASVPGTLAHAAFVRPAAAVATAVLPTPTKLTTGPDGKVQRQQLPAQATNEQILNTGLMALGPEAGGPEAAAGAAGAAGADGAAAAAAVAAKPRPIAAALSKTAAEQEAARILASRASNLDAVQSSLENGPQEIVPGSKPTTFQQTGDIGLGELENEVAARNRGQFAQRRADQNSARVNALVGDDAGIQSGADPAALSQSLRDKFAQLDATTEQHVEGLRQAAQQHLNDIGGADTPENYGQLVRESVQQAEDRARAWEGGLHNAVDPNNDLTVNVGETATGAQQILDDLPATARMKPDERELFETAAGMNPLSSYQDFSELKSRVGEAMRDELAEHGRTKTYRRLSQLNSVIQSNLANSITHQVVNESRAVEAGTLAPENTLEARLQGWVNDWKSGAGGGDAGGVGRSAASGATGGPGADAAGLQAQGGSGGAFGGEGLLGNPSPVSPLDPDELAHLTQAAQDYARYRAGPGPRGGLFQTMRDLGGLRLRDGGGALTPSGAEVADILDGVKRPGLINGKGLTPEAMQEALRERGWFGVDSDAFESGAATPLRGTDWNDFTDMLRREAAGNAVFHPEAGTPQRLDLQGRIKEDLDRAGVQPTDKPAEAIRKLAVYRAAEESRIADEARLLSRLKRRADSLGVRYRPNVGYDELLGDVQEREAIQAEGSQLDQHEAEIDQRLGPDQYDRHLDLTNGGLGAQPGAAGQPEAAAVGGEGSGGAGQAGASGAGAGGGGQAPGGVGDEGLTPTFDEAAVARKAVADAATRMRAELFSNNANETVLRKAGSKTQYDLDPGQVGSQYFKPGPTGFGTVRLLQRTIGEDAANRLLGDYAAMSLQRFRGGAAIRADGTLDPGAFAAWRAAHQDALRALPADLSAKFASAADAGRAVDEAIGQRTAALRDAKAGALGRIMGLESADSVSKTVGAILGQADGADKIRVLADAAASDPAAFGGLRQAVADHIAKKLIGNTEGGTSGVDTIKADAFQQFVKERTPALSHLFSPDEIQVMQDVAADIKRANRSNTVIKSPGRSDTTGDALAQARSAAGSTLLNHFITRAADVAPGGRIAAKGIGALAGALRQVGVGRVDQLLAEAMLNPEVAKSLLAKVPPPGAPGAAETLAKASTTLARSLRSAGPQGGGNQSR